jgi:hypothetical protein
MDSLRAFDEDVSYGPASEEDAAMERPPEIGVDERRMHVRAYNYWVSLLDGRPYPSIKDLDPHSIDDFGPNSVLLDFSEGPDDPRVSFLGRGLRAECELIGEVRRISDVPARSLLSRLTDHYMQIIANRAPIGFEAEFLGQRGLNTMYRGILMPFTSNGERIDFIYGVINWKELVDQATQAEIGREVDHALAASPQATASPIWADGPNSEPPPPEPAARAYSADQPELDLPEPELGADAGLADRLAAARDSADAARSSDVRSRAALYRALGHAYDFALAAEAEPEDYAEILSDAGLKPQARAPMTAVAKLVFGTDYDRTRLTEFAAALSWAKREELPFGGLSEALRSFEGGLKGIVQAERRARRPAARPDAGEELRAAIRALPAVARVGIRASGDSEFVLLLARREGDEVAILHAIGDDKPMIERALRKAAA